MLLQPFYMENCVPSGLHTEAEENHTFTQYFLYQVMTSVCPFWLCTINRIYISDFMGKQDMQKAKKEKTSVSIDLHIFMLQKD